MYTLPRMHLQKKIDTHTTRICEMTCPFATTGRGMSFAFYFRALLFDYRYITRSDLKSGRVHGRNTFFAGDTSSEMPVYANIECTNVHPEIQLKSKVGIVHLPCIGFSRGMGFKLLDENGAQYDIVAHVSITDGEHDDVCANPFTIDNAPKYVGIGLVRNPYHDSFLTDLLPGMVLFSQAFKNTRGSARQNAVNPNILLDNSQNKYNVFSFRPHRVHTDEILMTR
jgi:hypothetical protein